MTGPEHYAEAERLLDAAEIAPEAHVTEIQQAAQAHATLALAAATAIPAGLADWDKIAGWRKVLAGAGES
jgi:hypothetical protein